MTFLGLAGTSTFSSSTSWMVRVPPEFESPDAEPPEVVVVVVSLLQAARARAAEEARARPKKARRLTPDAPWFSGSVSSERLKDIVLPRYH